MEQRKEKEIKHYDEGSREWLQHPTAFEVYTPLALASYQFCYALLARYAQGKRVLDYGCGNGVHLPCLATIFESVVGIDLSEPSLEIARKRIEHLPKKNKITLLPMDCEHLKFEDNTFDVVFDGGTFSSLDFDSALKEIARVLKPDGCVIGVETFGHNPCTNFKRRLNQFRGKRTSWAADHILNTTHLERAHNYFEKIHVYYFHIISWIAFPFLGKPGGTLFLRLLEKIDTILFFFPFLRKYAFKIVFIFSSPIK